MFERKFMSADDGDLKEAFEKLEGLGLNPVAYREKEDILKELRRHLHTRARNRGRGGAEAIYHLARANIAKKKGGSRWRI